MVDGAKKEYPSLPPDYVSLAQLQERWIQRQQEKKLKDKLEEKEKDREARTQKKEDPSLPPDYVSLAQLQERWIQRQQEKELKDKLEEEKKERESGTQKRDQDQRGVENDRRGKMGDGSLRDVRWRRVEKDGREMGVAEVKGTGKEIELGGFDSLEERTKKNKEEKRNFEKKKSAVDGEMGKTEGDGCPEVEIIPRNEVKVGIPGVLRGESSRRDEGYGELKGIQERMSVSKMDVMPRNRVREEIPNVKKLASRSGLRRNGDDRGFGYTSKKEYRVKLDGTGVKLASEKKMEGEKEYDKKGRGRRNGGNVETYYQLKESRAGVNCNEVELESENKAEDESLEVCGETGGLNGRNGNGFLGQNNNLRSKIGEQRVAGEGLNDNRLESGNKVEGELLDVESAKNGENRRGQNGSERYGNWRGNTGRKIGVSAFIDWKADNVRSRVKATRSYANSGRYKDSWKTKPRESRMMWVRKEEKLGTDAAEVGSSGISADQE
ncbi:glutamic acid-rich protein-like [Sesamum indicum]|uniref:Glutamic acid-rich protein-like n=1 Tax=Sesamum indicum TaxID=4182 RepID=A0A6I9SL80_SESIN|nr:glutamic acid-rich protein-like [Sesamum indicum]